MARAPAAPFIAPYSGDLDQRLSMIADEISRNRQAISVLGENVRMLGTRHQFAASQGMSTLTGTTSATDVMMGFMLQIVVPLMPQDRAGGEMVSRANFVVTGQIANSVNNGTSIASLRVGQGTPPANGAAAVGTVVGQPVNFQATTGGGVYAPFAQIALVHGIVPGVTYWFDMSLRASGGMADLINVQATAVTLIDEVTL